MKPFTLSFLIAALLCQVAALNAQTAYWAKGFATSTLENLTTDADGNIFAASYYSTDLEIDGTVITPVNDDNSWLAKFNSAGTLQWIVNITSTDYAIVLDVRINNDQHIVICGVSLGEVDFTGQTFGDAGDTQARGFIAEYDQNGTCVAVGGTSGESYVAFMEVEPAPDGSYFVSGQAEGPFYFAADEVPGYGNLDAIYGKFDADLDPKWMRSIGDIGNDAAVSIALDSDNNIVLAGFHEGTFLFDGLFFFGSYGGSELFTVKTDATGEILWVRTMGSAGDEAQYWLTIETDASDNIYMSGNMLEEMNHSGGFETSYGETDMFVTSMQGDGFFRWFMHGGGLTGDLAFGMAKGNNDNLYIYGYFSGAAEFDGLQLFSDEEQDGFVCELGLDGFANMVMQTDGDALEWTTALAVDMHNNLVMAGYATGDITFGAVDVIEPEGADITTWLTRISTTYTIPDVAIQSFGTAEKIMEIYPNPSSAVVNISAIADQFTIEMLQILDVHGNEVMRIAMQSGSASADVSDLAPGCYLVIPVSYTGSYHPAQQLIVVD